MKSSTLPIVLTIAIIFILVVSWFINGKIIASGESAIPFYNFQYLLYSSLYSWTPSALGFPSSFTTASLPFYLTNYILNQAFQAGYIVQTIQFFLLLLVSGIFIIKYVDQQSKSFNFAFFSALFYLLNLFVIPNLWGRLQYPYLYFYAFLPLGFYIISKAFEERKKIYIFILAVLFFLFSQAFASIPLLELFWFIQGLYLLFFIVIHYKNGKNIIYAILLFVAFLISWILVNFWWFYQFFTILTSTSYITGFYTISGNTTTLITLSDRLGNLSYVFRLMHRDFFISMKDVWGSFYLSSPFIILSYAIPFLAFIPLLLKKKPKILYFFMGLSLIIIFLMKGSAEPFGPISLFVFSHIRFLEAFRNSFEKFGLALPFAYAPLVGYSCYWIYEFIKKKYSIRIANFSLTSLGILLFVVLVFPMWNRWVFTSNIPPGNNLKIGDYVEVPEYYDRATNWMKNDKTDFRNIALPIGGEGITYTWQYGYSGVELSNSIFNKPFISLSTTIQFLDNVASQIEKTLFNSPQHFTKMMSLVGAKYVMIRSDIDYKYRYMTNPNLFNKFIEDSINEKKLNLILEKSFNELNFYTNLDFIPLIYSAKNSYFVSPTIPFADAISLTGFQTGDVFINHSRNTILDSKAFSDAKETVVNHNVSFMYMDQTETNIQEIFKEFPHIRFLPNSPFYSLIRAKENLDLTIEKDPEKKFFKYLDLADKRLVELHTSVLLKNDEMINKSIINFTETLTADQDYIQANNGLLLANLAIFRQRIEKQQAIIDNLVDINSKESYYNSLKKAQETLTKFARNNQVMPRYTVEDATLADKNRIVFQYSLDNAADYEILLENSSLEKDFNLERDGVWQLNRQTEQLPQDYSSDWVQLGKVSLQKGENEIQFPVPSAKNHLDESAMDSGVLVARNKKIIHVEKITNIDPYASYTVFFSYKFEQGGCADIKIETIPDKITLWTTGLGCAVKGSDWETKNYSFNPSSGFFTDAQIVISVDPKGKNTKLLYKDLRIEKKFNSQIVLKYSNPKYHDLNSSVITFTKVNPAKYKAHIVDAKNPFYLVFLESYHPLWKASYPDHKKSVSENNHFLANSFANAWFIDRKGTYDIELEFIAEKQYFLGKVVSGIAIGVSLVIIIIYYIYKLRKRKK